MTTPHPSYDKPFDVAIVGAGFAGTAAAASLARKGISVALIDMQSVPAPAFRAEKFSVEQLALLGSVGMLEPLKAATSLATRAINIRGRHVIDYGAVEDRSLSYAEMVGVMQRQLPGSVTRLHGKVTALKPSAGMGLVTLGDGRRIEARLLVLATGHARALREGLGIMRRVVHPVPTLSIAFTLKSPPGGFSFPSLAAYGEVAGDGIDYSSVFPLGDRMRVNTFAFGALAEPRFLAFRRDPLGALLRLQPGLDSWLQGCEAVDPAEYFALELAISDNARQPGLVLIGDAFRTSCPAVGNGLSCLLVDVDRLRHHAPRWLATSGLGLDKIDAFYDDPVKRAVDAETHRLAIRRRETILGRTLVNRARRQLHFGRRRMARLLRPDATAKNVAAGWACHVDAGQASRPQA